MLQLPYHNVIIQVLGHAAGLGLVRQRWNAARSGSWSQYGVGQLVFIGIRPHSKLTCAPPDHEAGLYPPGGWLFKLVI